METHTLSADTNVSTLTLADGDTIALAGYTLTVDTDTSAIALTLSGTGILRMENGGGILIGAAVPNTVTVETENLPIRGNLDFNAAAVIKYKNNSYLRNIPKWTCPNVSREGATWAKVAAYDSATLTVTLDTDIPSLDVGDGLWPACSLPFPTSNILKVVSVNHESKRITFDAVVDSRHLAVGTSLCLVSAPLLVYSTDTSTGGPNNNLFGGDWIGGDVLFSGDTRGFFGLAINSYRSQLFGGTVNLRRVSYVPNYISNTGTLADVMANNANISVDALFSPSLKCTNANAQSPLSVPGMFSAKEVVCQAIFSTASSAQNGAYGSWRIGKATAHIATYPCAGVGVCFEADEADIPLWLASPAQNAATVQGGVWLTHGGTATPTQGGIAFFSPATAGDVAWMYADRIVKAHATLRLRCVWSRAESSTATASVAITNDGTWWPTAWANGGSAEASAEFSEDGVQLLTWRNDGDTDAQVRVWECVTGNTAGGYLEVEEVKGGAL